MNICVINGSPKGKYSITLQTAYYLEKKFTKHNYYFLNAGQKIKLYEKDMSEALSAMSKADLLIFTYPVYTFLVPSQLHRFVELMKDSGMDFSGKYATQISTSKHFYDMTAHRFMEDNLHDMGMHVIHGLSADMEDLLSKKGQADAISFMKYVEYCIENGVYEPENCIKTSHQSIPENSDIEVYKKVFSKDERKSGHEVVIVTDLKENDLQKDQELHNLSLRNMIDDFCSVFPYQTRLVNIAEYPLMGGCLGCFHCASDGKCIYKDGFDQFLREKIQTADAIVYAFTIQDHSMGSRFKMYDDRQFCNGHRTVTEGMPFGYLVYGDYQNEVNLQTVIEARCEVGHNFLTGVGYNAETLKAMSERLTYAIENRFVLPRNFYGVGGTKIFRDLIWEMQGLMKADHEYYKKHGVYDFPQKKRSTILKMKMVGALIRNPKIKAKMGNKMNEGMIAPYKKVIDDTL